MNSPSYDEKVASQIKISLLEKAVHVLITAHKDPDIDAIGSCLAFQKQLTALQIPSTVWLEDPLEKYATFLPGSDQIISLLPDIHFDTAVILDCPNLNRIRQENPQNKAILGGIKTVINIDHHPDNARFGEINLVCPDISSVGELLFYFFQDPFWPALSAEVATCLYAAISFDTGRFLFSNVTTHTLSAASQLMAAGAEAYSIAQTMYENKSLETFQVIQLALSRLVIDPQNRFAYSTLPASAPEADIKIIDFIRQLGGIDVFLVFCETKQGEIKINLRSKGKFNVSQFASQFGGGGHIFASGITLKGPLEDICQTVITKLSSSL